MAATIALIAAAGVALAGLVAALGLSWRAEHVGMPRKARITGVTA